MKSSLQSIDLAIKGQWQEAMLNLHTSEDEEK
jgi:hypothetical protein